MSELFYYETHMHTSQASACAHSTGAEMARAYKDRGYAGIVITDHFFNGNTAIDKTLPWAERVRLFCTGYEDAKAEGDRIGLDVFFGWEYADHGTEFLTYRLGPDFLYAHPDMLSWPIEDYLVRARAAGAFLIQAHPYRGASYIPVKRVFPSYVDAIEVENIGNREHPEWDQQATQLALDNHLPMTAGSDEHCALIFRGGGMVFSHKMRDIDELCRAIVTEPFRKVFPTVPMERNY